MTTMTTMTTAQLKKIGKEYAASKGLTVVSHFIDGIADKTAVVMVRKGKVIIERHIKLDDTQELVRNAYRQTRAAQFLKKESTLQSPDFYEMLTDEQKAQIEPKIFGFAYDYL